MSTEDNTPSGEVPEEARAALDALAAGEHVDPAAMAEAQDQQMINDDDQDKKKVEPPKVYHDIPDTDEMERDDIPDPLKDIVTDEALEANRRYHETQELAYAGRLNKTIEYLPGRTVRFHTPDQGERIFIGKAIDQEFGRLDPRVGISASYDDGVKLITLSVVVDELDAELVYAPAKPIEDPMNAQLSYADRQLAIQKKCNVVRKTWQYWYDAGIENIWREYRALLQLQREAAMLLPFYSPTGERQEDFRTTSREDTLHVPTLQTYT